MDPDVSESDELHGLAAHRSDTQNSTEGSAFGAVEIKLPAGRAQNGGSEMLQERKLAVSGTVPAPDTGERFVFGRDQRIFRASR